MTGPFGDVEGGFEAILIAALPALAPVIDPSPTIRNVYHVGSAIPSTLREDLPFIRVGWLAGADDGVTEFGVLDVEVFDLRGDDARLLAQNVREVLRPLPGRRPPRAGTFIVDTLDTQKGPTRLEWVDPKIRRYYASYRVSVRR